MAGIALKRSVRPCFHNGPSGGVIKIKRDLFQKEGSLKENIYYYFIFIGGFCVFNGIRRGYHLDFGDH